MRHTIITTTTITRVSGTVGTISLSRLELTGTLTFIINSRYTNHHTRRPREASSGVVFI
ncbi:MAG TPA: hypothetical protein VHC96_08000 [Puia sp.]|nr:hypothetical protein [Puia sp.]